MASGKKAYFCGKPNALMMRTGLQLLGCHSEYLSALEPIGKLFHMKYEEAKKDKSINTNIPEQNMFTTVTLTMLGMAERYAEGIVWADNHMQDHVTELEYTKDMILLWAKGR